ncbi:hypothetical protein VTK26DRAFT_9159 [Humicola hyalothermophila]
MKTTSVLGAILATAAVASANASFEADSVEVTTVEDIVTTTVCDETETSEPLPVVTEETTLSTTICPETETESETSEPEIVTEETTIATTVCPETESSVPIPTLSTSSTLSPPPYAVNTTMTYIRPTGSQPVLPPNGDTTSTPTSPGGPSTTTAVTGAGAVNKAAGALAAVGAFVAFFL